MGHRPAGMASTAMPAAGKPFSLSRFRILPCAFGLGVGKGITCSFAMQLQTLPLHPSLSAFV